MSALDGASSMVIDGELVTGGDRFEVTDPSTGEAFASAPECSAADLDRAMVAAERAQAEWAADAAARRGALLAVADVFTEAAGSLAPLLTAEQGRPVRLAQAEIEACAAWLSYYANLDVESLVIHDDERTRTEVHRRPIGVVSAIAPWNYPVLLAVWKLAPALRAGNTVVLKPSPYTPLTTLALGALIAQVLPPGVLNVVSGGDDLGRAMVSHPAPGKISFTGSVSAGREVAATAGAQLKRVTLELGGNDAAIVLDDVDPAVVAGGIFWGAFTNTGQVCTAIKRVYVPDRLHDELVDAIAARAAKVRVGPGMDATSQLGPLNNPAQLRRITGLLADAIGRGARVAAGGERIDRPGWFHEPTIVVGAGAGTPLVDEEQFGPVLPIIPYSSEELALQQANATPFGLGGSVWSSDPGRAGVVAAQLRCGTAWVNSHGVMDPDQPFGGHRASGLGVENGPWGLDGFCDLQVRRSAR